MKSAWVNYLAVFLLLLIAGIGALNLFLLLRPEKTQRVLKTNDVRGMAVEHDGLLYTLNFSQQNGVVSALNQSVESKAPLPTAFTRLVVYRFNQNDLIFSAEELSRNVPLLNILSTAYDTHVETAPHPKYHSH